jgi:hypothetical protein
MRHIFLRSLQNLALDLGKVFSLSSDKNWDVRDRERIMSKKEPRAESREPRAESREPRAESREPRAESREPRAESRSKRIPVLVATVIGIVAIYLFTDIAHRPPKRNLASEKTEVAPVFRSLPDKKYVEEGDAALSQPPENTERAQKAMAAFKNFLAHDSGARSRFYQTLEFFAQNPGRYAAARFMAMSGLYVTNPHVAYVMKWTQDDLKKNSEALMATLDEKRDQIHGDAFIHESFLNLAHQLDVAPERKLAFFGDTLRRSVAVQDNGSLNDNSVGFETALILSKQLTGDGSSIAAPIASLVMSSDERTKSAIKERVTTYFPDLAYLFR